MQNRREEKNKPKEFRKLDVNEKRRGGNVR